MSNSYSTGWIAGGGRVRATSFETGYMEWRAHRYAHGYRGLVRFSATFLQSFIRRSSINHPFFDSTVAADCIGGRPVPSLRSDPGLQSISEQWAVRACRPLESGGGLTDHANCDTPGGTNSETRQDLPSP